jgi:2-dehydro-3-deoxygalactonokinase
MRGEETQIFGVLLTDTADKTLILPGTHSKWVRVENREIAWFSTFITGELFDVLNAHSLLGQGMNEEGSGAPDASAFVDGLERAFAARSEGGGMFSQLFSVRTRRLIDGLNGAASKEYLSGLLIGSEISEGVEILRRQKIPSERLTLVGDADLCARYRTGLARFDVRCDIYPFSAAPQGLWAIANHASMLERLSHA